MKKIEKYNNTSILTTTIILLDCEVIKTSQIRVWESEFTLRRSQVREIVWFLVVKLPSIIIPIQQNFYIEQEWECQEVVQINTIIWSLLPAQCTPAGSFLPKRQTCSSSRGTWTVFSVYCRNEVESHHGALCSPCLTTTACMQCLQLEELLHLL